MVATDFEIKFAQSRVDYFEKVLKKGESDGLKTLLRAIKTNGGSDYSPSGIANAIKTSKTISQESKKAAVTAAAAELTTATQKDTDAKAAARDAANKLLTAQTAKATADDTARAAAAELTTATQKDTDAKAAARDAATELLTAQTAKTAADNALSADTTDAALQAAARDAASALQAAQDAKTAADKTATDAATELTTATKAEADAAAMTVGDDPVLAAAKALLGEDTVTKIKAETDTTKLVALYTDKATDFMKNYGFINAVLKNLPNQGKDVLASNTGAKTFTAYASDTLKDDALKAANAYFKIVATACGTGPFETTDLPEKDANSHHVKNCLDQANKVAYALLTDSNCGKDKLDSGNVKADCLKAIADKAFDLYNAGDFDGMNIDLSGVYPYDKVFSESDAITV